MDYKYKVGEKVDIVASDEQLFIIWVAEYGASVGRRMDNINKEDKKLYNKLRRNIQTIKSTNNNYTFGDRLCTIGIGNFYYIRPISRKKKLERILNER